MVTLAYAPGSGTHEFASTVVHQGKRIAKDGHNCGRGIVHLTYPANCALLYLHILFSKRKAMFGASTVLVQGAQTGLIDRSGGCPMLMCADPVSLPAQWAPTNVTNTVYVGSTAGDLAGGWAGIVSNAVIELIIFKVAGKLTHWFFKGHDELVEMVADYFIKQLLKFLPYAKPSKAVKKTVQKWIDRPAADPTPITPTKDESVIPIESPFGAATIAVTPNEDGSYSAVTTSPTSNGGQRRQEHAGLGLFAPAGDEGQGQPSLSDTLFQGAPRL